MRDYKELTKYWRTIDSAWQKKMGPVCKEFGISYLDRILINIIAVNGPLTKNELSRQVYVIQQNLTRALQRLEESGFISTGTDSVDLRRRIIRITEFGMETHNKLHTSINEIWSSMLEGIPDADVKNFIAFMHILSEKSANNT